MRLNALHLFLKQCLTLGLRLNVLKCKSYKPTREAQTRFIELPATLAGKKAYKFIIINKNYLKQTRTCTTLKAMLH